MWDSIRDKYKDILGYKKDNYEDNLRALQRRSGLHPSPSLSRPEDCVPALEQHWQAQAASVPACPLRSCHVCSQCS